MKNKFNLNLPYTSFPMKANLTIKELNILEKWAIENLYQKILNTHKTKKMFFLHDGPPYANGDIHIGHAFNKILKDIIIKSKMLHGYYAPFIPGWDCHGLPIEHKIEQMCKKKNISLNDTEFRIQCRKYAFKQVQKQKKDFIRLGIIADWDNPYLTMDYKVEANIIRTFGKVLKNHSVYQSNKPIHWCIQCSSSLAEAEIDYIAKYTTSMYVKFIIVDNIKYKNILNIQHTNINISLLIWTTTPWTIPANQAIAIHPDINYQFILINNEIIVVAKNLVKIIFKNITISQWQIIGQLKGKDFFITTRLQNPITNIYSKIIISSYVTHTQGTGIVHMAPNHGLDDYNICNENNIKCKNNIINLKGYYINGIHHKLNNIHVFNSDDVIKNILLKNNTLFLQEKYLHNYPCCWRHKTPIIYIATPQWFISMEHHDLRKLLLKNINDINWIPKWGLNRMKNMLQKRPDWCISRQRRWGIPIPLFVHKKTNKIYKHSTKLINKIASIVEKHGIQAWWDLKEKDFLGKDYIHYHKVTDILDVWFDSGSTYDAVVRQKLNINKIDMYLEGSDQYRGWFIAALVLSTITQNKKPYSNIISHGFTVDHEGKKMSKSIGNIIKPQDIIKKFGADVLRLWVASTDYYSEVHLSSCILQNITEIYRRIRNTIRYILANLNDFDPNHDMISAHNMLSIDKWIIHKTKILQDLIINDYNHYNIHNIVKMIMKFCTIELGSIYLDLIKDRQYTFPKKSMERLSCQTSLYMILESLVRWIMPILSFTAYETWGYMPGKKIKNIFTETWYDKLFTLSDKENMNNDYWNFMFLFKEEVNKIIEDARNKKIICSSLEANITLYIHEDHYKKISLLDQELNFFLLVSKVDIIANTINTTNIISNFHIQKSTYSKCVRCWYYMVDGINNFCNKCVNNTKYAGEHRLHI
ncbi:isoleucine--tRNA ligase [Enterobacteriaceae endosymbiont of Macroplea mutica]|uniref:isoleucine--tRNA ligase n=1 Tax=Enterobacteriaceae endosymbiont of Macroplea mutica TaxID=2675791 RepID=UPI00144A0C7B|nr:isoleucine--tRNA ligase [Enterobacteriaceae endosymbiont of Macroplea mutica]QJC31102.1 isoleucine--tRNA ligase [Enterobacteriaceae endosymbiont of Macroplea mutica]